MSLRPLPLLTICAALSVATIPVFANRFPGNDFDRSNSYGQVFNSNLQASNKQHFLRGSIEQLKLTEEQQQKIDGIRRKYKPQIALSRKNLHSLRQELIEMMANTESTELIRRKHEQLVKLQQELGELQFESMLEIREVLNPKQRRQFASIVQSRRDSWRDRKG